MRGAPAGAGGWLRPARWARCQSRALPPAGAEGRAMPHMAHRSLDQRPPHPPAAVSRPRGPPLRPTKWAARQSGAQRGSCPLNSHLLDITVGRHCSLTHTAPRAKRKGRQAWRKLVSENAEIGCLFDRPLQGFWEAFWDAPPDLACTAANQQYMLPLPPARAISNCRWACGNHTITRFAESLATPCPGPPRLFTPTPGTWLAGCHTLRRTLIAARQQGRWC